MESGHHVSVPLRAGKKMKKRKELDALVAHSTSGKRSCSASSAKRSGTSSQDQLLSESTDEPEDYWGSGGKSGGSRGGPRTRLLLRRRTCGSLLRVCTAALVFACVVATVTVMWLFIDIREQVTALRTELDQVVAGSQDVPDALQKCHSLSRELQQNQTTLYNRLEVLTLQLGNFSTQLTGVQYGLRDVEDKLKSAPELVNVPRTLKELSASVALFGSQIRDLATTVTTLKSQNTQLQETSKSLVQNVTTVKQTVAQLLNVSQQPQAISKENNEEKEALRAAINNLNLNISIVNETLNKKLQWLSEDQQLDHKLVGALREEIQNMSARVTTLEGECVKSSAQSSLLSTVTKLTDKVDSNKGDVHELSSLISQLQTQYMQLENNSSQLVTTVNDIKAVVIKLLPVDMDQIQTQSSSSEQFSPTQTEEPSLPLQTMNTSEAIK